MPWLRANMARIFQEWKPSSCLPNKTPERIIYSNTMDHFERNYILTYIQHGFNGSSPFSCVVERVVVCGEHETWTDVVSSEPRAQCWGCYLNSRCTFAPKTVLL